ncbi:type II 3-dehydroquinate dehydratase [bacterium]|nr:type II 3-dehydroquinate dehydratase [bacterium]
MKSILILNGPNLNFLGKRDPAHYGSLTLDEINGRLTDLAKQLDVELRFAQSNKEGVLIDLLQEATSWADGVVFNPGGYSHTSIAIRDAVESIGMPVIEVHLSNIYAREEFRHISMVSPVCAGTIAGLGWRSYTTALMALKGILDDQP